MPFSKNRRLFIVAVIDNEVIVYLEQILQENEQNPENLIKQAQRLRQKTKGFNLTQRTIQSAKEHGRP